MQDKVQSSQQYISPPAKYGRSHTSVQGDFLQRGDGRTFQERFKSRANLTLYA